MAELLEEGGVEARYQRYCENHRILVEGMRSLGFQTLLDDAIQSPIITSFLYPHKDFDFKAFYLALKSKGFVIYPGKISKADTFRIGNIGDVYPEDFCREIAYRQMNTDYTATRMLGYLYRISSPRPEDVVDEMLAILSDRNAIIQKKELEHAQATINKVYREGL